jgi:putative GTP pyrophosphokinase
MRRKASAVARAAPFFARLRPAGTRGTHRPYVALGSKPSRTFRAGCPSFGGQLTDLCPRTTPWFRPASQAFVPHGRACTEPSARAVRPLAASEPAFAHHRHRLCASTHRAVWRHRPRSRSVALIRRLISLAAAEYERLPRFPAHSAPLRGACAPSDLPCCVAGIVISEHNRSIGSSNQPVRSAAQPFVQPDALRLATPSSGRRLTQSLDLTVPTRSRHMKLDDFLQHNRVDADTWKKASIDWQMLCAIASDHDTHSDRLRDAAELLARVLQRFSAVHSVRWRVKDTQHLLVKIVRKRAQGSTKYADISPNNYFEIVTDLVGLRALHLFKDDCFVINRALLAVWQPTEPPIAYVREGDPEDLTTRFRDHGLEVRKHPAGYRSVHYVVSTRPLNRTVLAEVQVRTIFEEGWSEIDHRVRYPTFSNNPLVNYFLTIFNRLSGSADEMGTFVQGLTKELGDLEARIHQAAQDREAALTAMDKTLKEFDAQKKQDAATNAKLAALQEEVTKLRRQPSLDDIFASRYRESPGLLNVIDSLKQYDTGLRLPLASSLNLYDPNTSAVRLATIAEQLAKITPPGSINLTGPKK